MNVPASEEGTHCLNITPEECWSHLLNILQNQPDSDATKTKYSSLLRVDFSSIDPIHCVAFAGDILKQMCDGNRLTTADDDLFIIHCITSIIEHYSVYPDISRRIEPRILSLIDRLFSAIRPDMHLYRIKAVAQSWNQIIEVMMKLNPKRLNEYIRLLFISMSTPSVHLEVCRVAVVLTNNCLQQMHRGDRLQVHKLVQNEMPGIINMLKSCGDYEVQTCIVELLFRMTATSDRQEMAATWFPNDDVLQAFVAIRNFDADCRLMLNCFNNQLGPTRKVHSFTAQTVSLCDYKLEKPLSENYRHFWVDFSEGSQSITLYCRLLDTNSQSDTSNWGLVEIHRRDVQRARLWLEADTQVLQLTLACACFNLIEFTTPQQLDGNTVTMTFPKGCSLHSVLGRLYGRTYKFQSRESSLASQRTGFSQKCSVGAQGVLCRASKSESMSDPTNVTKSSMPIAGISAGRRFSHYDESSDKTKSSVVHAPQRVSGASRRRSPSADNFQPLELIPPGFERHQLPKSQLVESAPTSQSSANSIIQPSQSQNLTINALRTPSIVLQASAHLRASVNEQESGAAGCQPSTQNVSSKSDTANSKQGTHSSEWTDRPTICSTRIDSRSGEHGQGAKDAEDCQAVPISQRSSRSGDDRCQSLDINSKLTASNPAQHSSGASMQVSMRSLERNSFSSGQDRSENNEKADNMHLSQLKMEWEDVSLGGGTACATLNQEKMNTESSRPVSVQKGEVMSRIRSPQNRGAKKDSFVHRKSYQGHKKNVTFTELQLNNTGELALAHSVGGLPSLQRKHTSSDQTDTTESSTIARERKIPHSNRKSFSVSFASETGHERRYVSQVDDLSGLDGGPELSLPHPSRKSQIESQREADHNNNDQSMKAGSSTLNDQQPSELGYGVDDGTADLFQNIIAPVEQNQKRRFHLARTDSESEADAKMRKQQSKRTSTQSNIHKKSVNRLSAKRKRKSPRIFSDISTASDSHFDNVSSGISDVCADRSGPKTDTGKFRQHPFSDQQTNVQARKVRNKALLYEAEVEIGKKRQNSSKGLVHGARGSARGAQGLARGSRGLARGARGLARGDRGSSRGARGSVRGLSGSIRGRRYSSDRHRESVRNGNTSTCGQKLFGGDEFAQNKGEPVGLNGTTCPSGNRSRGDPPGTMTRAVSGKIDKHHQKSSLWESRIERSPLHSPEILRDERSAVAVAEAHAADVELLLSSKKKRAHRSYESNWREDWTAEADSSPDQAAHRHASSNEPAPEKAMKNLQRAGIAEPVLPESLQEPLPTEDMAEPVLLEQFAEPPVLDNQDADTCQIPMVADELVEQHGVTTVPAAGPTTLSVSLRESAPSVLCPPNTPRSAATPGSTSRVMNHLTATAQTGSGPKLRSDRSITQSSTQEFRPPHPSSGTDAGARAPRSLAEEVRSCLLGTPRAGPHSGAVSLESVASKMDAANIPPVTTRRTSGAAGGDAAGVGAAAEAGSSELLSVVASIRSEVQRLQHEESDLLQLGRRSAAALDQMLDKERSAIDTLQQLADTAAAARVRAAGRILDECQRLERNSQLSQRRSQSRGRTSRAPACDLDSEMSLIQRDLDKLLGKM